MEKYQKARTNVGHVAHPVLQALARQQEEEDGAQAAETVLPGGMISISTGKINAYVGVALEKLRASDTAAVTLLGMGPSVGKAVSCCEIIKRRIAGVHQSTKIDQALVVDEWEGKNPADQLQPIHVSRRVPTIEILLSRAPLDPHQPGYQEPLPAELLELEPAAASA